MNAKTKILLVIAILLFCVLLTGCAPGDGKNTEANPAGFFWGVWHGWIAPVSLIVSIFNKGIGIYEIHNNGFLYNLGYYMAVISGFGGLALARGKKD